ncbi:aldolase catalytic domain-containing protein [Marinobacter sp. DS40M6]|uniref:aldolase catalytic domain-containing protein n=1 Tax=Marinobacter sp. DS40M6 TaxID=1597776 RepID=UPI00235A3AEC|nr:aldolase catalytic domain-containing protein [Marinobacter sp. DS40M6]MDC8456137.1 aldolase catalytic domain-containing protein [Marinobacter sp. DS40M6]
MMNASNNLVFLDCTLRDGGYYNSWDFDVRLIQDYMDAMSSAAVDIVELGFRSLKLEGFRGACAYTTDEFLECLSIPTSLTVGVMVNGSELATSECLDATLHALFPRPADKTCFSLVRIACHAHEFRAALPAATWLKDRGFSVGFNLMQVADKSESEVVGLAKEATNYPVDVLYFADSMGGMEPDQAAQIIGWIRQAWPGPLGIHTHDNMGLALQNSLRALEEGVTWVDSTVTGMGRGPGNARTEEMMIEMGERRSGAVNMVPLMRLIREHFKPMQELFGWGTNSYYYLAGKYSIHPTYVQEMLNDSRYDEEDILAVIEHLRVEGGKKFNLNTLDAARHFYQGEPAGSWDPAPMMKGREVLLLGSGPGVMDHRGAIESYIRRKRPLVVALNTQSSISADLIDVRVACHPVRLLADCETHTRLPQPLITPASMLPEDVKVSLSSKQTLDFGLKVEPERFEFGQYYCSVPTSLVIAYALAIVTSGRAERVLMSGFDGYGADDPRSQEMQNLLSLYQSSPEAVPLVAVTPTRYSLPVQSIYAL